MADGAETSSNAIATFRIYATLSWVRQQKVARELRTVSNNGATYSRSSAVIFRRLPNLTVGRQQFWYRLMLWSRLLKGFSRPGANALRTKAIIRLESLDGQHLC